MKPKAVYLVLSVVGALVPYWPFVPWVVAHHGIDLGLFTRELFVNRISAFFGLDVFMSAVALVVFMRVERSRVPIRHSWLPLLGLVTVGVSLALPLYLYLRELALENPRSSGT